MPYPLELMIETILKITCLRVFSFKYQLFCISDKLKNSTNSLWPHVITGDHDLSNLNILEKAFTQFWSFLAYWFLTKRFLINASIFYNSFNILLYKILVLHLNKYKSFSPKNARCPIGPVYLRRIWIWENGQFRQTDDYLK